MSDNGKGDAPRQSQDAEAYSQNWERIFQKQQAQQQEEQEDGDE